MFDGGGHGGHVHGDDHRPLRDQPVGPEGHLHEHDRLPDPSPVGTLATITFTTSALLPITRQVTINGYSQGGPTNTVILIQLNLNGHNGLVFNPGSGNSTVQGLAIFGGSGAGIEIDTNNVTVAGNIIGANHARHRYYRVGATGNVVQGNFIGTNASGAKLGNGGTGVRIYNSTSNNTIGGTTRQRDLGQRRRRHRHRSPSFLL